MPNYSTRCEKSSTFYCKPTKTKSAKCS